MSRIGLRKRMTVQTPNAATRTYTTTLTNVPVALYSYERQPVQEGMSRVDLTNLRFVKWPPEYTIPDNARLIIDGTTWQVRAGTVTPYDGRFGRARYYRADVTRAQGT